MASSVTILWLRRDLRLADHPALVFAAARGRVVPVFILDENPQDKWKAGSAMRWWLHQALLDLSLSYKKLGVTLVLRRGEPLSVLQDLIKESGADCVAFSRLYDPFSRQRDAAIETKLSAAGIAVNTFNASLLFEPCEIQSKSGAPYKVYTPFSKACFAAPTRETPRPSPSRLAGVATIQSDRLEGWGLLPSCPDWAKPIARVWKPGETAGQTRLGQFLDERIGFYKSERDRPDRDGTSCLSPYLALGQIGSRQIWHAVHHAMAIHKGTASGAECFLKELLWREFSYHLLHHVPHLPDSPIQPAFAKFRWRKNQAGLQAWQRGMTGYPIVDAGMRQLWQTGWMHNRVRMIVASFLVKDLLLPWQAGESWFWETLIDADLASNAASWQWVSGCGADAAPYFRVFNPVLQGQKFDPDGAYVRRYVPELQGIRDGAVHAPWLLEASELRQLGVVLGQSYPQPIVDHALARKRALEALKAIKET